MRQQQGQKNHLLWMYNEKGAKEFAKEQLHYHQDNLHQSLIKCIQRTHILGTLFSTVYMSEQIAFQ